MLVIFWSLAVRGASALLLSEKLLMKSVFHQDIDVLKVLSKSGVCWESSYVRQYLNGEFLGGFSDDDRSRIIETTCSNPPNPWYDAEGCAKTVDKIFLLSIKEVAERFGDSGLLKSRPQRESMISDEFNAARIARDEDGEAFWWWLRSPGNMSHRAAFVNSLGQICLDGYDSDRIPGGLRPALWVRL